MLYEIQWKTTYPYLLEDGKAAKIGAIKKGIWVEIKSRDSIYRKLTSFLLSSSINTTEMYLCI